MTTGAQRATLGHVATTGDDVGNVTWCEGCTELVTIPEHEGRPVHAATGIQNCADNPHASAHPVKSTPEQREIVLRLRPDYPEYQFTVDFGVFITASIPGALTHLSEKTEEELRGRLESDRSRRRWARAEEGT